VTVIPNSLCIAGRELPKLSYRRAANQKVARCGAATRFLRRLARGAVPLDSNVEVRLDMAPTRAPLASLPQQPSTTRDGNVITARTRLQSVVIASNCRTLVDPATRLPKPAARLTGVPGVWARGRYMQRRGGARSWPQAGRRPVTAPRYHGRPAACHTTPWRARSHPLRISCPPPRTPTPCVPDCLRDRDRRATRRRDPRRTSTPPRPRRMPCCPRSIAVTRTSTTTSARPRRG
jgi:hypothetical protein